MLIKQKANDRTTIRALRRVRRDRRLGTIEWFDVAYRVYLFALGGTALVVWASDYLGGVVTELRKAELLAVGPGVAGMAVAIAVAIGLRHGAEGGPVALEPGDVRHLLLAPVSRRSVLTQPVAQRMRSVAFMLALPLAIIGQLVGRDTVGSRAAWAAASALFGALVGLSYVAIAVLAHGVRLSRPIASMVGAVLFAWQLFTCVATWRAFHGDADVGALAQAGPFDLVGNVAMWGVDQRLIDVLGVAAVLTATLLALSGAGRLRIEPLERRGDLVSQLRFAATVQDIRTVVLLRRQLSADGVRPTAWFARQRRRPRVSAVPTTRPHRKHDVSISSSLVVRRGLSSFRRFSAARLTRVVGLAAFGGFAVHAALEWSSLAYIALTVAALLIGLELTEPLGQEVDRPDRTDGLPVDRSELYSLLLVAPAIASIPVAIIGAAVVTTLHPERAGAAFALSVPVVLAGSIGSVVTTVRDAPRPTFVRNTNLVGAERTADNPFTLPEFAGVSTVINGLVPLMLSALCIVPVVALDASPSVGVCLRAVAGVALCLAVLVWWVRRRDRWALRVRTFFVEGRAHKEAMQ